MDRCIERFPRSRKIVQGPRGPNDFSLETTSKGLLCSGRLPISRMNQKILASLAGGSIEYRLIKTMPAGVQAVKSMLSVGIYKGRFHEEAGLFACC